MKSLYYIIILTSILIGCSEDNTQSNQRILNSIKLTREYLSAKHRNDFNHWTENNKDYNNNDSAFNSILNQIEKIRNINNKYSHLFQGVEGKSDSFKLKISSIQDLYKNEILKNLNNRTRSYLSKIPYENIITGKKIIVRTDEENELVKEAILNELEMNNFSIPNLILRQWGEILPHCNCCDKK